MPAEGIDRFQRPEFIVRNDAGMEVCENRLSCESSLFVACGGADECADLVAKGAVLRKGERLRSKFCKYSKGAMVVPSSQEGVADALLFAGSSDSIFAAVLYVSDSERLYR